MYLAVELESLQSYIGLLIVLLQNQGVKITPNISVIDIYEYAKRSVHKELSEPRARTPPPSLHAYTRHGPHYFGIGFLGTLNMRVIERVRFLFV